jgi:hypothetical protein
VPGGGHDINSDVVAKKRLELLQAGDQSMAASIELSYGLLDAEMRQRWRAPAVSSAEPAGASHKRYRELRGCSILRRPANACRPDFSC